MGRKKLPDHLKKRERPFKANDQTYEKIKDNAEKAGKSINQHIEDSASKEL